MARDRSGDPLRLLSSLFNVGVVSGLTDRQLLEQFATHRDEAGELAFKALVDRHGPMVLRACRGILRTSTTPWTPSRQPSSSWSARAARCGSATHWPLAAPGRLPRR